MKSKGTNDNPDMSQLINFKDSLVRLAEHKGIVFRCTACSIFPDCTGEEMIVTCILQTFKNHILDMNLPHYPFMHIQIFPEAGLPANVRRVVISVNDRQVRIKVKLERMNCRR
jgi:hypothetical protein